MLSEKIEYEKQNTKIKQSVRIIPNAVGNGNIPVILFETSCPCSVSLAVYHPVNKETYLDSLSSQSITRFNMSNLHCSRSKVYSGGTAMHDGYCYIYAVLDLPQAPQDWNEAYSCLYQYLVILAACLGVRFEHINIEQLNQ